MLKSGSKVYRLRDGKCGKVLAMWESGNERYALVEFDKPHVPDAYEHQRDLCVSPLGHRGAKCVFCGYEVLPKMRFAKSSGPV